jgi:hypothetical protein
MMGETTSWSRGGCSGSSGVILGGKNTDEAAVSGA